MPFAGPTLFLLVVGGLVYSTVTVVLALNRHARGARTMSLATVGAVLYFAGVIGRHQAADPTVQLYFLNALYTGLCLLVPSLFVFILHYVRTALPSPRAVLALGAIPILSVALIWTNASHELMWTHPPVGADGRVLSVPPMGFWYKTIYLPYQWGLLALIVLVLGRSVARPVGAPQSTSRLSRAHSVALMVAVALPFLTNLWTLLIAPEASRGLSPTAFAMTCCSGILVWVFARLELISVSRTAYRRVMAASPDGFFVVGETGRIIEHNPAVRGFTPHPGSLVGRRPAEVFAFYPALAGLLSRAEPVVEEVATPEGRYWEVQLVPIVSRSAEPRGRAVVIRDITLRKRSENALRESEAMVRSIVDHSPNGILRLQPVRARGATADFTCTFANPAAAEYLETTLSALVGAQLRERMPWLARRVAHILEDACVRGVTATAEVPLTLGASLRWFRIIAVPVGGALTVTFIDVTEEHLRRLAAEGAALEDPLTGLLNRRGLERAPQLAASTAESEGGHTMLYLDLDGFKEINDEHGHAVGDGLLREFAARLRGAVRDVDVVARLGGDEFVVGLVGAGESTVEPVVERLMASLSAPYLLDGRWVECRPSVGLARYPDHGRSLEAVLRAADRAMYAAKAIGGGLRTAEAAA